MNAFFKLLLGLKINILVIVPQKINSKILEITDSFQHVIWDWNGTLVDDVHVAVESINVLLSENQMEPIGPSKYRDIFRFPVQKYYEDLGFNFSKTSFEKLSDRFIEEYNNNRAQRATLFPGVHEVLSKIKEKNKTQSILSAAAQWHLEEITDHFQISQYFHNRYGIDNHHASSKLDRGRELVADSRISKEDTVLLGDTDHDFEVAEELGISCVLIADGHQSYKRLSVVTDNIIFGRRSF